MDKEIADRVYQRMMKKTVSVGECIQYTGSANRKRNGYGMIWFSFRNRVYVHRFSYEFHHGEIPKGMVVMHTCDNSMCVRAEHLMLGTHRENMEDMARKGRGRTGQKELHWNAKLNKEKADAIREAFRSGTSKEELIRQWGVHRGTINRVLRMAVWA